MMGFIIVAILWMEFTALLASVLFKNAYLRETWKESLVSSHMGAYMVQTPMIVMFGLFLL